MSGDLDVNRVASLSTDFLEASGSAPSGIVVDLSEVTFCDVACLRVLANVARRADETGTWLRLAGASSMVRRLLQITGLDVALACFADVGSATRGSGGAVAEKGAKR